MDRNIKIDENGRRYFETSDLIDETKTRRVYIPKTTSIRRAPRWFRWLRNQAHYWRKAAQVWIAGH